MFKSIHKQLGSALFMFALTGLSSVALAEELTPGAVEAHAFVGGTSDSLGATFGGGIAKAIKSRWLAVGEFGYFTGYNTPNIPGVNYDSSALEFGVNAHYLFPLKNNEKLTPYVLGGLGVFRSSVSYLNISASDTNVGLNLGGGVRYQAGQNWGVRPELKFFISDGSYTRFSVGVYYQFGKK